VSQPVPIASLPTRAEAEVVVALLESEGIAATISADDAGGAYPFSLSGGAQVLVDEDDAKEAADVIARSPGV